MASYLVALSFVVWTCQLVNSQALNGGQTKALNAAKSIAVSAADMTTNQNNENTVFNDMSSILKQVQGVMEGSSSTGQGGASSGSYYGGSSSAAGTPDPLNNDEDLAASFMGAVGNSIAAQSAGSG